MAAVAIVLTGRAVLQHNGIAALTYGQFDGGYLPLRETMTHVLASQGIRTRPDNILITSGSQQALALVCQILLKPGDVILVESIFPPSIRRQYVDAYLRSVGATYIISSCAHRSPFIIRLRQTDDDTGLLYGQFVNLFCARPRVGLIRL
jgi:hypothetical protein